MSDEKITQASYKLEIEVKANDIDLLGHVNNVVYLRYVQEAAVAHWTAAASKEDQGNYLWVVSRHEIDYLRPIFKGQEIFAKTWVGKASKGLFERHTELFRKEDSKLVARARTLWCPISPTTMRPTSVGSTVYERFSTNQ